MKFKIALAAVFAATLSTSAMADDAAIKAGLKVFKKCKACHTLAEGKHKVGPSLAGIIGAKAGAIEGYKYSKVMGGSDIVWTVENLTAFLTKPKKFMKGTKMAFNGLKKPKDIENLLAYIDSKK